MNTKKRMRKILMADPKLNETLLDLLIGCFCYSAIMEVIGLLVAENKGSYSLGLLFGTLVAAACSYSMYRGLIHATAMDPHRAGRSMTIQSILRMLVMLVSAGAAMLIPQISFYGVVVGLMGLKIAAYLHVYTNVYITRKLLKKGR